MNWAWEQWLDYIHFLFLFKLLVLITMEFCKHLTFFYMLVAFHTINGYQMIHTRINLNIHLLHTIFEHLKGTPEIRFEFIYGGLSCCFCCCFCKCVLVVPHIFIYVCVHVYTDCVEARSRWLGIPQLFNTLVMKAESLADAWNCLIWVV